MTVVTPRRPSSDEYVPYYGQYIQLVPDGDVTAMLEEQLAETVAMLSGFSEEQSQWRPAPGEWNAVEIVGHLADTERVFAYRALSFARNDPTALPGFDQDVFMLEAGFARRPLGDVVAEFVAVRRATVALLKSLDAAAWERRGAADGNAVSVRALAYILAGHERHHRLDFPRHRDMVS